jgi:hypothetical protein
MELRTLVEAVDGKRHDGLLSDFYIDRFIDKRSRAVIYLREKTHHPDLTHRQTRSMLANASECWPESRDRECLSA